MKFRKEMPVGTMVSLVGVAMMHHSPDKLGIIWFPDVLCLSSEALVGCYLGCISIVVSTRKADTVPVFWTAKGPVRWLLHPGWRSMKGYGKLDVIFHT